MIVTISQKTPAIFTYFNKSLYWNVTNLGLQ